MIVRALILCLVILAIDIYVFQAFRFSARNQSETFQKGLAIAYWCVTAFSIIIILSAQIIPWETWPKGIRTYSAAFIFVEVFSKLFVVIFLLTDDIVRLIRWLFWKFSSHSSSEVNTSSGHQISRSDFLVKSGLVVASLPFISLIWGMVKGAYDLQVRNIRLVIPKLPEAFKGYKIVQISDAHVGSFITSEPVRAAVERINSLNPDVILFTGDLVNNRHDEVIPHIAELSKLKAKHGIFSVLGNHDYGDYVAWDSPAQKADNLKSLVNIQRKLGWDMLIDEHRVIEKDGHTITLIGVQNWSTHLRFPKYGSLEKATSDIRYSEFNILMSHDPSHWQAQVLKDYPKIDLTLSGHTHGFQFGVEIPGIKWSPVQYIYKEWAGLYHKAGQYLYVNRGVGFLGYPGRVGILPEITLFELHQS